MKQEFIPGMSPDIDIEKELSRLRYEREDYATKWWSQFFDEIDDSKYIGFQTAIRRLDKDHGVCINVHVFGEIAEIMGALSYKGKNKVISGYVVKGVEEIHHSVECSSQTL